MERSYRPARSRAAAARGAEGGAERGALARQAIGTALPERPCTVERAYQLARSGDCRGLAEIAAALKRERHEAVDAHLAGPSIKRDLRRLCEARRR